MLSKQKVMAFIPTLDVKRAREFYEGTIGLRFVIEDDFALVLDSSGTTIRVAKVHELSPAPFTILGWEVTGIQDIAAGLRKKGVSFERYTWAKQDEAGIWTAPGGAKVAWFKDPDGNVLSISEHA
jgi:catechol 2,3-dioxygenase-like lactoylglutathione lyase family enzyme